MMRNPIPRVGAALFLAASLATMALAQSQGVTAGRPTISGTWYANTPVPVSQTSTINYQNTTGFSQTLTIGSEYTASQTGSSRGAVNQQITSVNITGPGSANSNGVNTVVVGPNTTVTINVTSNTTITVPSTAPTTITGRVEATGGSSPLGGENDVAGSPKPEDEKPQPPPQEA